MTIEAGVVRNTSAGLEASVETHVHYDGLNRRTGFGGLVAPAISSRCRDRKVGVGVISVCKTCIDIMGAGTGKMYY